MDIILYAPILPFLLGNSKRFIINFSLYIHVFVGKNLFRSNLTIFGLRKWILVDKSSLNTCKAVSFRVPTHQYKLDASYWIGQKATLQIV